MSTELEGVSSSFELILKNADKVSKQLDDFVTQVSGLETIEIGKKGVKLNISDIKKQVTALKKDLAASFRDIGSMQMDTKGVFANGQEVGDALGEGIKKAAKERLADVQGYLDNVMRSLADAQKLASGKTASPANMEAFKSSLTAVSAEIANMRTLLVGTEKEMQALAGPGTVSEFTRLKKIFGDVNSVLAEFKGASGKGVIDPASMTAITSQVDKTLASMQTLDVKTSEVFSNIQSKLTNVDVPKELNFEAVGTAIVSNIHSAFTKVKADTKEAMKAMTDAVEQITLGDKLAAQIMSPKVANSLVQLRENMDALQAKSEKIGSLRETMSATTDPKASTALGAELKKELVEVENLARRVAKSNMALSNEFFAQERAMLTSMSTAATQLKTDFLANSAAIQRIADDTMRFKQAIGDSVTKLGLGVDVLNQQENINKSIVSIIRAGGEAEAGAVAEMVKGTNAYKQTMAYAEKLHTAEAAIVASRLTGNQALSMAASLIKEQVSAYKQAAIMGSGTEAVTAFDKMVESSKRLAAVGSEIKLRENIIAMTQSITSGGVPAVEKLTSSIAMYEATSGKAFGSQKTEVRMVRTLVDELAKRYEALGTASTSSAKAQQRQVAESISAISSTMLQQGTGKADEKAFAAAQKLADTNREALAVDQLRANFQDELIGKFTKIHALQVAGVDVAKNYGRMQELYVQAVQQGVTLEEKLVARIKDRATVMSKLASEVDGMRSAASDNYLFPAAQINQLKGMVETLTLMRDIRSSMDKKNAAATVIGGKTVDVAALDKEIKATQEILRTREAEVNASLEGERVHAAILAVLDKRKALEQDIVETLKVSKEMAADTLGAYDRYIAMADALIVTTQKGIPIQKELLNMDEQRRMAVKELFTEYSRLAAAQIENKGGPQEGLNALQRQRELLTKIASIVDRDYTFQMDTGNATIGIGNINKLLETTNSKLAKLDELWKTQDKLFGKADSEALRSAAQTVQNIRAALQDVAPTIVGASKGYDSMIDAVMRADLAVGKYASKLRALHGEQLSNSASTAKQREETLALTVATEREMAVIRGLQSALGGADAKLRTVGSSMTDATTDPQALTDRLAGDPKKLAAVQEAMQRVMTSMRSMSDVKISKGTVLDALNTEAQQFLGVVDNVITSLQTVAAVAGKVDLTKVAVTPQQGATARAEQEQLILKTIEKQYTELLQGVNVLGNWEALQKNITEAARQGYDIGKQNMAVLTSQEDIYRKMFETAKSLYNTAATDATQPKSARVAALEQSLKLLQALKAAEGDMPNGVPGGMDFTKTIEDAEKLRATFGTELPSALEKLTAEAARLEEVLRKAIGAAASPGASTTNFTTMQKGIEGAVAALNTLKADTSDTAAYSAASTSIQDVIAGLQKWRAEQEKLNTNDGEVTEEFKRTSATLDNIVNRMANWVEKNSELRAAGGNTNYATAQTDIKGIVQALGQWKDTQGQVFTAAQSGAVFDKTAVSMDRIIGHLQDWKRIQDEIYKDGANSGRDADELTTQRAKVREAEHLLSLMQQMKAVSDKISVKTASVGVDSSVLGSAAGAAQLAAATKETPKLYMDVVKASQEFSGLLALMEKAVGKSSSLGDVFKTYSPSLQTAKTDIDNVNSTLSKYAAGKARAAANSAGSSIFDVARMSWFIQLRSFWSMYMGVTQTITAVTEYTHTLAVMKATTESSAKSMAAMDNKFMSLGQNVPIATTKIAEAALEVAKAGMDAEDTIKIIESATKLAHATKADITMVADVITVSLTAWGQSADKAAEISDMMFSAMSKSRASMEGMQQAMGYLSGIAPQANVSIQETLGLLAVLTNAGLSMSKAATYSRQVLNDLMNPSAKLVSILGSLGVSVREVDPRFHSLAKIFKRLADAGMNVSQAFEGMSVRGANAFSVALSNADKLEEFTESLEGNGALLREYGATTQDVASQFTLLMNSFTALGNAIKNGGGEFLMGVMDGVRDTVYGVIAVINMLRDALGEADVPTRAFARNLTKLLIVVGTGVMLLKLATFLGTLTAGLTAASGATGVLTVAWTRFIAVISAHPLVALATAAAAVVTMIASQSNTMSESVEKMAEKIAQLREEINKLAKLKLQESADVGMLQRAGAARVAVSENKLSTEPERENAAASFRGAMNVIMQTGNDEAKTLAHKILDAMPSAKDGADVWKKFFKSAFAQIDEIKGASAELVKSIASKDKELVEKAKGNLNAISANINTPEADEMLADITKLYQRKSSQNNLLNGTGIDTDSNSWTRMFDYGKVNEERGEKAADIFGKNVTASVLQLKELVDGLGESQEAQKFVDSVATAYQGLAAKLKDVSAELKATNRNIPASILDAQNAINKVLEKKKKWEGKDLPTVDTRAADTIKSFGIVPDKASAQDDMDVLTDISAALKDVSVQAANLKSVDEIGMLTGGAMDAAKKKINQVGDALANVMERIAVSKRTLSSMPAEEAKNVIDSVKSLWQATRSQMTLGDDDGLLKVDQLVSKVQALAAKLRLDPAKLGKMLKLGKDALPSIRGEAKEGALDSYGDLQGKISDTAASQTLMDRSGMFSPEDINAVSEVLASLIKTQFAYINSMMKTKYAVENAKLGFNELSDAMTYLREQFGEKLDTADYTEPAYSMATLLTDSYFSMRKEMKQSILSLNEVRDSVESTNLEYAKLGAITGKNAKQSRALATSYSTMAGTVTSQMSTAQSKIEASLSAIKELDTKMRSLHQSMLDSESQFLAKVKAIRDSLRNPDDSMKISVENINKQSLDVSSKINAGMRGEDLESSLATLRDAFVEMASQYKFQPQSVGYLAEAEKLQKTISDMQQARMSDLKLQSDMAKLNQTIQTTIYMKLDKTLSGLMEVLTKLNTSISNFGKPVSSTSLGSKATALPTVQSGDTQFLKMIKMVESSGDMNALNKKSGARGSMQVMPATLRQPGYDVRPAKDAYDPKEQQRVGIDLMNAFLKKYNGDVVQAISAYNYGPGVTDSLLRKVGASPGDASKNEQLIQLLPQETKDYIDKVAAMMDKAGRLVPEKVAAAVGEVPQAAGKAAAPASGAATAPVAAITGGAVEGDLATLIERYNAMQEKRLAIEAESEKLVGDIAEARKNSGLDETASAIGTAREALYKFNTALGETKDITVNTAVSMFTSIKDSMANVMTEATRILVTGEGDIDAVFDSLYWTLLDAYFKMMTDLATKMVVENFLKTSAVTAGAGLGVTAAGDAAGAAANSGMLTAATTLQTAATQQGANAAQEAVNVGQEAINNQADSTQLINEGITNTALQTAAVNHQLAAGDLNFAAMALTQAATALMTSGGGGKPAPEGGSGGGITGMLAGMVANFFPGSHTGGLQLPGYDTGGLTTQGNRQKDSMLAALTKGEFVVQEPTVNKYGVEFFNALNAGKAQEAFDKLPGISDVAPMNESSFKAPQSAATASPNTGQPNTSSGKPSVSITNLVDPKVVERYLTTDRGKNVVRNVVSSSSYFSRK